MNFERIKLLLDVFHSSINVPNTDRIRNEAMAELIEHNSTFADVVVEKPEDVEEEPEGEPVAEPAQEEIKVAGRRI